MQLRMLEREKKLLDKNLTRPLERPGPTMNVWLV